MTQNIIKKRDVFWVSISGLMLCGIIFFWTNIVNLYLTLISIIGLISYTYFKRKWWGGPFYNAAIVVILCLIGFFCSSYTLKEVENVWFILGTVFFGYANFVLVGYFKDISADKTTGYNTLPVVFGRKIAAIVSTIFAILTAIFALLAINPSRFTISLLFYFAGLLFIILTQIKIFKIKKDEEAHVAIKCSLHSYILLLSAMIAHFKESWVFFLVLFYIEPFSLTKFSYNKINR